MWTKLHALRRFLSQLELSYCDCMCSAREGREHAEAHPELRKHIPKADRRLLRSTCGGWDQEICGQRQHSQISHVQSSAAGRYLDCERQMVKTVNKSYKPSFGVWNIGWKVIFLAVVVVVVVVVTVVVGIANGH